MTLIAPKPFMLNDCILTIGTDSYESSVSSVAFNPAPVVATFKGMKKGAKFNLAGESDWTAAITLAQDWETADALSRYLMEHEGETVPAVFKPTNGKPGIAANLTIVPGSIGGGVGTVATSSVTLNSDTPVLDPIV
jgi:hypothetical protein